MGGPRNTKDERISQELDIYPQKRNAERQNGCLRRPYKLMRKVEKPKVKEKRKVYPSECRVPKNIKER